MIKKSVSISVKITAFASIISMLAIVSLFIWVMFAPRSINFVTPYIEKELNSISPGYSVLIDQTFLKWDSSQRSMGIHVTNIRLQNDTRDTIATLPEISFGFSLLRFLRGHLLAPDVTIFNPKISINTHEKTLYVTPEKTTNLQEAVLSVMYKLLEPGRDKFTLYSIRLKDADIYISNGVSDMLWKLNDFYAKLERKNGAKNIKSEFEIVFGKDKTYFSADVSGVENHMVSATLNFNELPSYIFNDLFPDIAITHQINMVFSGSSSILFTETGDLSQININLDKTHGSADIPEFFKDRLEFKNIKLDANIYDKFKSLSINNAEFDVHGPLLKVSGNFTNAKEWPEFLPSIDAEVKIANLPANDLESYWPYNFGNKAWQWVTHNIRDGVVTKAQGKFLFSAADIQRIIDEKKSGLQTDTPPVPENAIDAAINVEHAKISFHERFPHVDDVKALVKFSGHGMDASVESGKVLGTAISNARVKFDNLWQEKLRIDIDGNFNGNAADMVKFLEAAYNKTPENQTMASIYKISGHADGNVNLSIPIIKDLRYDDVNIKISSNLKDVTLPALINGKDLTSGNIALDFDKYDVKAKGRGVIGTSEAQFDVHKIFSDAAPYELKYRLQGNFTADEIKELGGVQIPFVEGEMGLDVNITESNAGTAMSGTVDLTQSTVNIPDFGFEKPVSLPDKVSFSADKNNENILTIPEFSMQGKDIDIQGNAVVNMKSGYVSEANLNKILFDGNDLTAKYVSSETSKTIDVKGKSLDLRKSNLGKLLKQEPGSARKALKINANLNKVYMKNGEMLDEFTSEIACSVQACTKANLYGKLRKDYFVVMSLKNIGDRSLLLIESDNAGAIINAFNISKNIRGGHLNIEATLGKNNNVRVARGVIKIFDFTAAKTPLLGKILTLASFQGFEDLLNNQGISFKKFEAPFIMEDGLITVDNARSSGSSIGITAEGTIDTDASVVDLHGVIVPAYEVNKIIGKIPVVGKIILGGKNEGVIATKYSIKGPYEDAKVSVNPLSILTPGFLRNIFDIFD